MFMLLSCYNVLYKSGLIFCIIVQELRSVAPPDKTKDDILLFFKLYDPEKEVLRYRVVSLLLHLIWTFA